MGRWFSEGQGTLRARWKLLVASVLAAALIGLSCGLCESSTKVFCTKIIASLLSLTDLETNAQQNKLKTAIMSRGTIHSITITSGTSLNGYAGTSLKKYDTSTAANMEMKISGRTITLASLTAPSMIRSLNKQARALQRTQALLSRSYGLMASAPSVNLTSKLLLIRPGISLKRLTAKEQMINTSETMTRGSRSGSNLLTSQCL